MINSLDTIGDTIELESKSSSQVKNTFRPEFIEGASECRHAVLTPHETLGLSHDLRAAVARRIAKTSANPNRLLKDYISPNEANLKAFAIGDSCTDPKLAALAIHVDMIASEPHKASKQHLSNLQEVGFSVPQIIAISELCAYVCFQIRLVHGLSLLEVTS